MVDKNYIADVIYRKIQGKKYKSRVLNNFDKIVDETYTKLKNKDYVLKPISYRYIKERDKERKITISAIFPNKILDYLLTDQFEPIITKSFYYWCVGNVKGKGKNVAIDYVEKHIKNYKYVIKLDVEKFFHNIDKGILYNQIRRKISDKDFLDMYASVIGKDGKGLELGLNSSQSLANLYLTELDYFIKQELKAKVYIRYGDDMLIMGNNKRKLHHYIRKIQQYLKDNLKLTLNNSYQLYNLSRGDFVSFIGYRFSHKKTLLKQNTFNKFIRLYKRMVKKPSLKRAKTVISLWGWFIKTSNSHLYYIRYLKNVITFKQIIKIRKGEFSYELATTIC